MPSLPLGIPILPIRTRQRTDQGHALRANPEF
jgi:hypothetical protein